MISKRFLLGLSSLLLWLLVSPGDLSGAPRPYKAENEAWYTLIDQFPAPATLYPYNNTASSIYRKQHFSFMRPNLRIYAPDEKLQRADKVLVGYDASWDTYRNLFEMGNLQPEVHIFLVKEISTGDFGKTGYSDQGFIILIGEKENENIEHTTIHELMHVFQRASGIYPVSVKLISESWRRQQRWFIEGPAQFSPILVGAPEHMLNKTLLYFKSTGKGRFEQALRQAHGKSMVKREELACLFWYYYYRVFNHNSLGAIKQSFFAYRGHGFSNQGMDWFNFDHYWHDFALAQINKRGPKTGIFKRRDSRFKTVPGSALKEAEQMELPYGKEIELEPLSQKYFTVENLDMVNGYVVFSLPEKEIPDGVEISAVLRRASGEEEWIDIKLDGESLGSNWVKRFPIKGKAYLDGDADIEYDRIVFVFSNFSDSETETVTPVISGNLYQKFAGRGVETKSGVTYRMYGNVPLGGDQYLHKGGGGFRLYVMKDEIRTIARNLWFERDPQLEFEGDDLGKKAMRYLQDNGIFRGEVYFRFKALIPEEIKGDDEFRVEKGKIKIIRERKDKFYNTPNLFKVRIDKQDLLIMVAGDTKAMLALVNKIEQVVDIKYKKGTYGRTLSQLFQQTMALDTRAYNSEYDVTYERGKDHLGRYLKIKLGKSMWFILRQVDKGITVIDPS